MEVNSERQVWMEADARFPSYSELDELGLEGTTPTWLHVEHEYRAPATKVREPRGSI